MLVLTRKVNEKIMVGEEIEITVLGISGNQIRVGVEAPKNIDVHRQEVYERIHKSSNENESNKSESNEVGED